MQGSAADIIKKAMILIDDYLASYQSFMVMQVHDELVFDVRLSEKDKILKGIVQIMESCVLMSVPLIVDVESGKSWGD